MACTAAAQAAVCDTQDAKTHVSGQEQCIVVKQFGSDAPENLVVWLHGDISSGGPANYHFETAERLSKLPAMQAVRSVAMVRPGYQDGFGNQSSVAFLHSQKNDHYTQANVLEVGAAIARLRAQFSPKRVLVVGHSGGAATAALLLGMKPGLIDAAVLIACPCDISAWRSGRSAWSRSESPSNWVDKVALTTQVIALTGDQDDNTLPKLAENYVAALQARKIDAQFKLLAGFNHNAAFRAPEVRHAIEQLLGQ
jgi:pimeloyl-ACP methyl ester carboxylesterase